MEFDARKIRLVMDLRGLGISDQRVLSALEQIPRERFVAAPFAARAYDDASLPIPCGQTISPPYLVAFLTQALNVSDRHKVLEIGTGSGYHAAILAKLCRRVYTVERYRALTKEAEVRFAALGLTNVTTRTGDGTKGWPEQAPFPRILITAAAEAAPEALIAQLAVGGHLVMPIGQDPERQVLTRFTCTETGVEEEALTPARFAPLIAALVTGR